MVSPGTPSLASDGRAEPLREERLEPRNVSEIDGRAAVDPAEGDLVAEGRICVLVPPRRVERGRVRPRGRAPQVPELIAGKGRRGRSSRRTSRRRPAGRPGSIGGARRCSLRGREARASAPTRRRRRPARATRSVRPGSWPRRRREARPRRKMTPGQASDPASSVSVSSADHPIPVPPRAVDLVILSVVAGPDDPGTRGRVQGRIHQDPGRRILPVETGGRRPSRAVEAAEERFVPAGVASGPEDPGPRRASRQDLDSRGRDKGGRADLPGPVRVGLPDEDPGPRFVMVDPGDPGPVQGVEIEVRGQHGPRGRGDDAFLFEGVSDDAPEDDGAARLSVLEPKGAERPGPVLLEARERRGRTAEGEPGPVSRRGLDETRREGKDYRDEARDLHFAVRI